MTPMSLLNSLGVCLAALLQLKHGPITNAFNDPSSPLAHSIKHLTLYTLLLVLPFILLAEILLVVVIFKFRAKPGRKPATFTENHKLEFIWTLLPIIALIFVAVPTYHVLHRVEYSPAPDLTVDIVGHQFYWEYKYPAYNIDFSSHDLVVPAGEVVDLNITSGDVIHAWYVPALGVQMDAVPGRITTAWFKANPGYYKGQCAQLCGANHGKMLIQVRAIPPDQFQQWVSKQQAAAASSMGHPPALASGPAVSDLHDQMGHMQMAAATPQQPREVL